MKIEIRRGQTSDLQEYTKLLQKTYQDAYVCESLGLTKKCFSREVFNTEDSQKYLASRLDNHDKKTWLAFLNEQLIGAITLINRGEEYELTSFYIDPEHQGRGLGKRLFNIVLMETCDKDIILDIYSHNKKTIDTYKKWGFEIDKTKGTFTRHWPEWPEGLEAECLYMRLKAKKIEN